MSQFEEFILSDLSVFADLGTAAPRNVLSGGDNVVRLVRNGREVELILHSDGSILERGEDGDRRHIDARALLASPNFGDLGRWADAQKAFLSNRVANETIPVLGTLSGRTQLAGIEELDAAILPPANTNVQCVRILLVDGPAGIGKTSLIRALTLRRAVEYRKTRRPLVLHVESRGRMLQNIVDLMAFSLQTLRVNVTYDQVPILVRHGLLTLAIDGFDELADPNGYELAWAQVNDLVVSARGCGSLLLAGRETFIGRDRLIAALSAFRNETDELDTYSVNPITPIQAKAWLQQQGWTTAAFDQQNVEPLFEPNSYALRPFFLVELARDGVRDRVESGAVDDLTWFLVETMLDREATKFGSDVEAVVTTDERIIFLRRFLGEVARDLADNQTEAIASDSLAWIAEVVATDLVSPSVIGIIKNRAGVIAFLTEDDRQGYRRFSHAQLLNHFLSRVTIDAVLTVEVPKYIRRNIFGADFLTSFSEVLGHYSDEQIYTFIKTALRYIDQLGDSDRSRRNLGALVLVAMGVFNGRPDLSLSEIYIDEALVIETAAPLTLKRVVIAQLDARGADLRGFVFDAECHVFSLIADPGTILAKTFPSPQRIQLPERVLTDPDEIVSWISEVSASDNQQAEVVIPSWVRGHGLFELTGRACRYRHFWIREAEERAARRILQDHHWNELRSILAAHDLLTVRNDVPASGQAGEFFHIRRKDEILAEAVNEPQIREFYEHLVQTIEREMAE